MTPRSGVTEKPRLDNPWPPEPGSSAEAENPAAPPPLGRSERTAPSPATPVLNSPVLRSPTMRSRAPRSATPPSTSIQSNQRSDTNSSGSSPDAENIASGAPNGAAASMAETAAIPASLAASAQTQQSLRPRSSQPITPVARQDNPNPAPFNPASTSEIPATAVPASSPPTTAVPTTDQEPLKTATSLEGSGPAIPTQNRRPQPGPATSLRKNVGLLNEEPAQARESAVPASQRPQPTLDRTQSSQPASDKTSGPALTNAVALDSRVSTDRLADGKLPNDRAPNRQTTSDRIGSDRFDSKQVTDNEAPMERIAKNPALGDALYGDLGSDDFSRADRRGRTAIWIFAGAVFLIILGVLFLPSPLKGRFGLGSTDVQSSGGTEESSPLITRPPRNEANTLTEEQPARQPLGGVADGTNPNQADSLYDSDSIGADIAAITSTTAVETTTSSVWEEPVVEPESQWVDAGNGIALPDVLFRIRFCESTNNYESANATSSARGAYQFLTMSWEWYGHAERYGVPSANLAAPGQQDEAALKTFEQDGAKPWAESRACWDNVDIDPRYRDARPKAVPTTSPPSESTVPPSSAATTSAPTTTEATTTTTAPSTTESTTTSTQQADDEAPPSSEESSG